VTSLRSPATIRPLTKSASRSWRRSSAGKEPFRTQIRPEIEQGGWARPCVRSGARAAYLNEAT
jgi:hypothetical protein